MSLLISFCIRSRFFCWNLNLMGLMNGFLVFYWEILSLQSFLSSFSLLILELWNIIKLQGHFYSLLVRPAPNLTQFISQRCFKKKKRTLHYTFEDLKFYNSEKKLLIKILQILFKSCQITQILLRIECNPSIVSPTVHKITLYEILHSTCSNYHKSIVFVCETNDYN